MADTASLSVRLSPSRAKRVVRGAGKNLDSSSLALLGMTKSGFIDGLRRSKLRFYRAAASCFLLIILAAPLFATQLAG